MEWKRQSYKRNSEYPSLATARDMKSGSVHLRRASPLSKYNSVLLYTVGSCYHIKMESLQFKGIVPSHEGLDSRTGRNTIGLFYN